MTYPPVLVRDITNVDALIELVIVAAVASEYAIHNDDKWYVPLTNDEVRAQVIEFFDAVAEGSVILSMEREVADIPLDIIDWRIETGKEYAQ